MWYNGVLGTDPAARNKPGILFIAADRRQRERQKCEGKQERIGEFPEPEVGGKQEVQDRTLGSLRAWGWFRGGKRLQTLKRQVLH